MKFYTFLDIKDLTQDDEVLDLCGIVSDQGYFSKSTFMHDIIDLNIVRTNNIIEQRMIKLIDEEKKEEIPSKVRDILNKGILELTNNLTESSSKLISHQEIYQRYIEGMYTDKKLIKTGLICIPELQNQSMITIAGRSGIGKTFFSIYLANQLLKHNDTRNILFFSLEMPVDDIWKRHLSILGNKHFDKTTEEEKYKQMESFHGYQWNTYEGQITIEEIELLSKIQSKKSPLTAIVVDYIGLVKSSSNYERKDLLVGDVSQRLAALSIELNTVVIALSQVNRDSKHRGEENKCPVPTDAADSSGSERSSSLWIGIDQTQILGETFFVLEVRKNRYGELASGKFKMNNGLFQEVSCDFQSPKVTSLIDKLTGRPD